MNPFGSAINNSYYPPLANNLLPDLTQATGLNPGRLSVLSPALAAAFGPSIPISMIPSLISSSTMASMPNDGKNLDAASTNVTTPEKQVKRHRSRDASNDPDSPKPYCCAHCTWSFSRPSDLRRHLKSHNAPQYHCPFWNATYATCPHRNNGSFNRLDVLKRHLKLVHYEPDNEMIFKLRRKNKREENGDGSKGGDHNATELHDEETGELVTRRNDGGYCLSCGVHFTTAKDFIGHVSECALNTPMQEWKYKKNGAIASVKKQGDNPNGELEERTDNEDSDEDQYFGRSRVNPNNKIKTETMPPNLDSEASSLYCVDSIGKLSSLNSGVGHNEDILGGNPKKRKYTVSVSDLDNKPEIMDEALKRKRGRPKKNYAVANN